MTTKTDTRQRALQGLAALALVLGAGAAQARGDVQWSISIGAPVYAPPPVVYLPPPRPVYLAPPPPPVYVQPAPMVYGYSYGYVERPHHHHHHRRGWRDSDGDGVPDRYDRRPGNPWRY